MTDFYRNGAWVVTDTRVQTPRADFDLSSITAVEVSRAPFYAAASIGAAALGATWTLRPILYASEILIIASLAIGATLFASRIGWMRVSGSGWRGTPTGLVVGPIQRLRAMREAVREAQENARRVPEPEATTGLGRQSAIRRLPHEPSHARSPNDA